MTEYRNVEILGVGTQPGGRYGKVLIAGSGKLTGAVECESFELPGAGKVAEGGLTVHGPLRCFGAGKVEGPVSAASLEVSGSFKSEGPCLIEGDAEIAGSMKAEGALTVRGKAEVAGSMKSEGDMSVGVLKVAGSVKSEGSLKAVEISVNGTLSVDAGVQAERFHADGIVKIEGELNADVVELMLVGQDEIESVVGGSVTVRKQKSGFFFSFGKRPHLLSALIEADEVDLEYTDCETVRGVNVHIGSECVIDRVEYSGTLTTDPYAQIGEKVKI